MIDKNYKVTTIINNYAYIICRPYKDGDIAGEFAEYDCYIDNFKTLKEANDFISEGLDEEPVGSYEFFNEDEVVSLMSEKITMNKASQVITDVKDTSNRFQQIR